MVRKINRKDGAELISQSDSTGQSQPEDMCRDSELKCPWYVTRGRIEGLGESKNALK